MAMASALRISCSSSRTRPFLRSSLCYMSSLPSEAVDEKEKSRVTLNAPLEVVDPEIAGINELEKARQSKGLELIPSENFTSVSVMQGLGCTMTNFKSVVYPGRRSYSGFDTIDMARTLWQIDALQTLRLDPEKWGVIEQPLSGVSYNFQVFTALLKPHERIMASDPAHHGYYSLFQQPDTDRISVMSIFFETMFYRFNRSAADDFDQLEKSATLFRPKLIAADASVCSQPKVYARFRKILLQL